MGSRAGCGDSPAVLRSFELQTARAVRLAVSKNSHPVVILTIWWLLPVVRLSTLSCPVLYPGTLLSLEQTRLTITQALFSVQTPLFQIQVVLLQDAPDQFSTAASNSPCPEKQYPDYIQCQCTCIFR